MKKIVLLTFVSVLLSTAVVVGFVKSVAESMPVYNIDSGKVIALTDSTTTVYLDPPTINGTEIGVGNTVTVNISISDAVDIYAWQAGLIFNATLLNCTGFFEGEFLSDVGPTNWIPATINNTAGLIGPPGCSLIGDYKGSGSGRLGYLSFEVKELGVSDLHLRDVMVTDYYNALEMVPFNIIDVYTIVEDTTPHTVVTVSNSTGLEKLWDPVLFKYVWYHSGFYGHAFMPGYGIGFNVTGPYPGFSNVTIPETLMSGNPSGWTVMLDGISASRTVTYNGTHYSVYFTYSKGVHTIQITSSYVVPEFPTAMILPVFMFFTLITVAIVIHKRRLFKTPIQ